MGAFTIHDCFKVCSMEPLVNKCICRFIYYENYQEKDHIESNNNVYNYM